MRYSAWRISPTQEGSSVEAEFEISSVRGKVILQPQGKEFFT